MSLAAPENARQIFDPNDYVVDFKGNRWMKNHPAEVENIEELRKIAAAQRGLILEAKNILANMEENYVQVQAFIALKLGVGYGMVNVRADLDDLQTHGTPSESLG